MRVQTSHQNNLRKIASTKQIKGVLTIDVKIMNYFTETEKQSCELRLLRIMVLFSLVTGKSRTLCTNKQQYFAAKKQ